MMHQPEVQIGNPGPNQCFFPSGFLFFLLLLTPLAASAQTQQDFLKTYMGQPFLLREYGALDERVKLKKENVGKYKGSCDLALEVDDAKFTKGSVEFTVEVIGFVIRVDGKQLACPHLSLLTKKVIISSFTGQEAESELEAAVSEVLLTPEAYLTSYGAPLVPPVDNPETPIPTGASTPRPLLMVHPTYPAGARLASTTGQVAIGIIIGRDGRIHEPTIVSGTGSILDALALRVLPLLRFEPARLDGQNVATRTTMTTSFSLLP